MLTADHGGNDVPERENQHAIPDAGRAAEALTPASMGKALAAKLGLPGPVLLGAAAFGDFYIDRNLLPAARARALAAAIAAYRAHPQVAAVFTHEELGGGAGAVRAARDLDPARPRQGELRSGAVGRFRRAC